MTLIPTNDQPLLVGSLESADTDGLQYSGKVLSVAQGNEAARDCGLVFLSVLKKHLGSLDKVVRIVKLTGTPAVSLYFVIVLRQQFLYQPLLCRLCQCKAGLCEQPTGN